MKSGSGVCCGRLGGVGKRNRLPPPLLISAIAPLLASLFSVMALINLCLPIKHIHCVVGGRVLGGRTVFREGRKKAASINSIHFKSFSTSSSPTRQQAPHWPHNSLCAWEGWCGNREGREAGTAVPPTPTQSCPPNLSLPHPGLSSISTSGHSGSNSSPIRQTPSWRLTWSWWFAEIRMLELLCLGFSQQGWGYVGEWRGQFGAVVLWERNLEVLLWLKVSGGQYELWGPGKPFLTLPTLG